MTDKVEASGFTLFALWLLAFVRIILFFVQAPIWGSHHMPHQVLAGSAALISIIIFPSIPVPKDFNPDLISFVFLLLIQALIGLVIGFVSFIVMAAAQFAGEVIDVQTGLSTAASFDPASHGAVNLIRRFKFYMAMIMYLMLDGHHVLLLALARSFEVLPLTSFNLSGKLMEELIRMTGSIFYIGLQIATPVLAALFITQLALGLLARVAPQMNVFMLSFPLNILVGLSLLGVSLRLIYVTLENLFVTNAEMVMKAIKLMIPRG